MRAFTKATAGAVFAGSLLLTGGIAPASAQPNQDGLINVAVGDITIEDINVGVAAAIAANACDIQLGPVVALGRLVDRSGGERTVCTTDQGEAVRLIQN